MAMTPRVRKLALTAHVTSSVCWLGGVAGVLLLLLVATVLAVYKPRGMTRYGARKQHEQRALSRP
jgi:hypothetical protein